VCLHFPSCEGQYDIKLKSTTVFYDPESSQVWGNKKLAREFHKQLVKLTNKKPSNCEALYCQYLTKLYGDMAQTMYLLAKRFLKWTVNLVSNLLW
jgi:hypothetical protein